jgi:diguanylate cyclase (GGDEF)-like protein/PAS domain S-box-containing protein
MLTPYRRLSLKAKLAFWASLVMVVVVVTVTSLALWALRGDMQRSAADAQAALADSVAQDLDNKINDRRNALVLSAAALGSLGLTERSAVQAHFDVNPLLPSLFDSVNFLDRQGTVVFDTPVFPGRVGLPLGQREYFKQAMATGQLALSEPLISKTTGEPTLVFAAPMRNKRGELTGALCGVVYLTRINFLSAVASLHVGKGGYAAVISKGADPRIVVHPQRNRIYSPVSALEFNPRLQHALQGYEGTVEAGSDTGPDALYTYRHLKSAPWVLLTAYPAAEAYARMHDTQREVVALALVLMLLAGAGTWWLVARLMAPLGELQQAMVQARAQGTTKPLHVDGETRELRDVVDAYNALMAHHHETQAALRASELRLRLVADNLPAQITHIDTALRYSYVNAVVAQDVGMPIESIVGRPVREVRGDALYAHIEPHLHAALRGELRRFEGEFNRHGEPALYMSYYVPDRGADGSVQGVYAMSFDITQRKRAELRQAESEKRLRDITDNLPVLISYIDRHECLQFANATYRDWLGIDPVTAIGKPLRSLIDADLYLMRQAPLKKALAGERVQFELESTALGVHRHLHTVYVPDVRADGDVAGLYALSTDVSALKAVQHQLDALARVDTLTGLPNRRAFDECLHAAVARSHRHQRPMALMFLDVDRFKPINDTHGHGIGDEVLSEFARRLHLCVRQTDTVARLAGDEFVIVLEDLNHAGEAEAVARKIAQLLAPQFVLGELVLAVTASIGIAHLDGSADITPADALARADRALYEAKRRGRNTFVVWAG